MRKKNSNDQISVHAIAGIEVVLLGIDADKKAYKLMIVYIYIIFVY